MSTDPDIELWRIARRKAEQQETMTQQAKKSGNLMTGKKETPKDNPDIGHPNKVYGKKFWELNG